MLTNVHLIEQNLAEFSIYSLVLLLNQGYATISRKRTTSHLSKVLLLHVFSSKESHQPTNEPNQAICVKNLRNRCSGLLLAK